MPNFGAFIDKNSKIPIFEKTSSSNILHNYRTFNYVFTLACVKRDSLLNPESLRNNEDYYLVAKSSGKGNAAIKETVEFNSQEITQLNNANLFSNDDFKKNVVEELSSHLYERQRLVEGFNKNSSGRFDFFIDNLEIDSVMGGDNKTNLSIATNITFDVYEPYSIHGFLESLQVAAVAAGHNNYISAPYLLKVEFIGHADTLHTSALGENLGNQATRYFIIVFNSVDIEMTAQGTMYKCSATPFNERGFGDITNKLKVPVQITGKTVKEILLNLEQALNDYEKTSAQKVYGSNSIYDQYEIKFPSLTNTGLNFEVDNEISRSKVNEFLTSNQNYRFSQDNTANQLFSPVAVFADNSNIHDAISAILRDSQYTKDLIIDSQTKNSSKIDSLGFVTYFSVNIEVIPQKNWNSKLNRPFYTYRYLIIPYKLHHTRIPLLQNNSINLNSLKPIIAREYDYIYTGNNTDIIDFNLKFNHLYYQAIPTYLGNTALFSSQYGIQPSPSTNIQLTGTDSFAELSKNIPTSPVGIDLRNNNVQVASGLSTPQDFSDPYDAMVKNFHQAILDNLSMIEANVQILGDPYYLLDGGISNYYPKLLSYALTADGQAPYYIADIFINITFRNPFDIDPGTGQYLFSEQNKIVPFSGIFRVIGVVNRFNQGLFQQDLKLIRVPGQVLATEKTYDKNPQLTTSPKNESPAPANNATPTSTNVPAELFPVNPGGIINRRVLDISQNTAPSNTAPSTLPDASSVAPASVLNNSTNDSDSTLSTSVGFRFGNRVSTNPLRNFLNTP